MTTPTDRRYTDQHEWALVQGTGTADGDTVVRIGITDHAQDALGDIVFVQLPEVGEQVGPGNPIGEVESTKSVSDVYAPIAGVVTAVNAALADAPETINSDPYGEGWLVEITAEGGAGDPTEALLDAAAYQQLVDAG
ncbi:MAG: glycine cleavage system protein [Blastococcus sp.]|jgi:glycine cleavage system H protein|nr:glycine cleavage system protein [Blastococcus sp.]